ncbi:MAG: hypothetical protein K2K84_00795 [Muribaculaceae bacterium]|nr:hypothetical protein [Muribaculaceae bacterium]
MTTQEFKVPSWLLSVLFWMGAIGIIISFIPLNPKNASILDEYENIIVPILSIGDVLNTIGEVGLFSLVAYKLKILDITKPSPTIIWVLAAASFITFVWDDFVWATLAMTLIAGIACISNQLTKKIGVWMIIDFVIFLIILICCYQESMQNLLLKLLLSGGKVVCLILCWPAIKVLMECKKFMLRNISEEDSNTDE